MTGSLKLPIKFQTRERVGYEYTRERVRYEYKCPYCGHINVRYEKCGRIVCDYCKREFVPSSKWISW